MRFVLIAFVRIYQTGLSPLLGSNCRHEPTCSTYAIESLKEWGSWKGLGLTLRRIAKCHPWGTSGHDPVPKNKSKNK
ncbi:MAG TPA: membrane protein insertion efficiency factor YidD [Flavobacteriales bacterium]|nr:membrane protein insertion efficiency factor YidD [Flavobacteriales bacterium]HHZ94514.1 membrane protein insertion efficiency factor YidD [Flavobacteriales bacterium]HIB77522.1 membrane protein insertion efficiency factor YidD [Flavobacteriales bacterium]HIN41142.1 membrane protein insertion efficiency factor YidD [Flavobacteriales bacterium]HIO58914.1 membrane protein insertion efficiency factor YidD [Flavobacteriales bacterium]